MRLELLDCVVGGYSLEHLLDSKENMELIADFSVSNNAMGLERLPEDEEKFVHLHIKPKYDEDCIFMSQRI